MPDVSIQRILSSPDMNHINRSFTWLERIIQTFKSSNWTVYPINHTIHTLSLSELTAAIADINSWFGKTEVPYARSGLQLSIKPIYPYINLLISTVSIGYRKIIHNIFIWNMHLDGRKKMIKFPSFLLLWFISLRELRWYWLKTAT